MDIAITSTWIITLGNLAECKKLFSDIRQYELIDRLYRRYVRYEDIEETYRLLTEFTKKFSVNYELFLKLMRSFEKCWKDSECCFKKYGEYIPIRLIISNMPFPLIEEDIPLEDYDNLEGDPLWMRPEYMIEKYG